jgi:hypothetical protein
MKSESNYILEGGKCPQGAAVSKMNSIENIP